MFLGFDVVCVTCVEVGGFGFRYCVCDWCGAEFPANLGSVLIFLFRDGFSGVSGFGFDFVFVWIGF